MKGLVITTDDLMRTEEYTTPLHESIGKTVGGWIEVVHPKLLPAPYCMIVNEEGLLLGLPVNLLGSILYESFRHGNPIVGNMVIPPLYRVGRLLALAIGLSNFELSGLCDSRKRPLVGSIEL